MDDGELDISGHLLMSNPDMSNTFDEFLTNTTTCTHTHTCNPPGPTAPAHTHTCYHTHTQVFASAEGEREEDHKKPRKPLGNREAVRKYREKKKAHAAYLEEEVKKLRVINQQLTRRLQGQAALEAEVVRLKSLLVDLRAKIDGELGVYPFQKPCSGLPCNENMQCVGLNGEMLDWDGNCMPPVVDCQINLNGGMRNLATPNSQAK
ncbi:uncharacterized protein A4U43_C08F30330 [Asparagus officinalis]|uniref:basic leucine zipper 23-like n=1 Tax=Asparagus officinalis TaxID=4686 RepID=UPI00098DECFE|nr:basic leucine zipper 23-like [Asparagus officinalis]ONK61478.1 uncharacterized protein A4U43_C08F30330 [Asparagus officinalis]